MSCSACGPMCEHTNNIAEFVQQKGGCNLIIQSQLVVADLVLLGVLFFVVVIETIVIIGYGCHLCYLRRRRTKSYQLVKKSAKGVEETELIEPYAYERMGNVKQQTGAAGKTASKTEESQYELMEAGADSSQAKPVSGTQESIPATAAEPKTTADDTNGSYELMSTESKDKKPESPKKKELVEILKVTITDEGTAL